ncbi:MAG: hypothetical protein ABIG89_01170 [Candidatus Woesearchaeota archaeon]
MSIDYKVKDAKKSNKSSGKDSKSYSSSKKYDSDKNNKQKEKKYEKSTAPTYEEITLKIDEHERLKQKPKHKKGDFAERMEKIVEDIEEKGDGEYKVKSEDGKSSMAYFSKNAKKAYEPVKKKKVGWMNKDKDTYRTASTDNAVVEEYDKFEDMISQYQGRMPGSQTFGEAVKNMATNNLYNIARNAYDNTIGYFKAARQNKKTIRHLQENPCTSKKVVYLMHGVQQNIGSQWRLAEKLEKQGYLVYHLGANHSEDSDKVVDKAFEDIKKFHKKANIKKPEQRNDHFTGHSSGADAGILMSTDERILKAGIKHVQARAPVPFGMKIDNLGKRLIAMLADVSHDDLKNVKAKKRAIKMAKKLPKVPVFVVAGKKDYLAEAKTTAYPHADKHFIIDHEDSSHFGTSGGNDDMNAIFANLHKYFEMQHRRKNKMPKEYDNEFRKAA